ncbi:isochorismatase family protein [Nocardioides sp.]|uniref:isochorismatase family protein n=1 Tax=Nocardioides sp. TaxID=35761 RepID=UPI002639925D|nr:isochorismatase family protein [Nocardioides sp.]
MTLPDLVDYAVPTTLPESKAPWRFDPSRAAVLVHDLQHYFLRPFAPGTPVMSAALANTAALLSAARAAGVPVFYTAQTGEPSEIVRGLQGELWGPGMQPIAEHTTIVPEVAPAEGDTVLVKHRYSAFAHSDLADRLAAAGRDQLVITGVYAHIGVTATAFDAFQREVRPFVLADAVADFSAEAHERALAQVASCMGVVATTAEVLAAFEAESEPEVGEAEGFEGVLRRSLDELLPADVVEAAYADPGADLFELGLDSIRAFDLLDALAEIGVDVDFGEFARSASLTFLRDASTVAV